MAINFKSQLSIFIIISSDIYWRMCRKGKKMFKIVQEGLYVIYLSIYLFVYFSLKKENSEQTGLCTLTSWYHISWVNVINCISSSPKNFILKELSIFPIPVLLFSSASLVSLMKRLPHCLKVKMYVRVINHLHMLFMIDKSWNDSMKSWT